MHHMCSRSSICTVSDPNRFPCHGFENAKVFSILRDPVDRVWSFYNYLRPMYKPYQQYTLDWILENDHVDLETNLTEGEKCMFCAKQLKNAMTEVHFSSF